jgi:RNA polymerase sigma-70 factor (ECF subfamily)
MTIGSRTNTQWLAELTDSTRPDVQASAIEALRERLQRGIYYYMTNERSDTAQYASTEISQMSQDFAQDAVLRILRSLETFRGDSQFITWAMKIAARVAVSELRRARYKDFSLDTLTAEGDTLLSLKETALVSQPEEAPERQTERQDVLEIIRQAFDQVLTDRQRLALEAVGLQGVPMDVVAEQLNTNRNALYKLLHDARKKLKGHLEEQGLNIDYVMGLFAQ